MNDITVEHGPEAGELNKQGVFSWPVWEKEISEFPWKYDEPETCYFLEGEAEVVPDGGQPVVIKKGDLVVFPRGMTCRWKIRKQVKKHYKFG